MIPHQVTFEIPEKAFLIHSFFILKIYLKMMDIKSILKLKIRLSA